MRILLFDFYFVLNAQMCQFSRMTRNVKCFLNEFEMMKRTINKYRKICNVQYMCVCASVVATLPWQYSR